jgi:hypothetical protein
MAMYGHDCQPGIASTQINANIDATQIDAT